MIIRTQTALIKVAACALLVNACATVEYTRVATKVTLDGGTNRVSAGVSEQDAKGIRYYDSSPYLIVHSNADGTLATRIEYLPDPNKKMAVLPKARGAKVDATFEFNKGVLVKSNVTGDATVVPKAILKAAEAILPSILDITEKATTDEQASDVYSVPPPQVFKILVRGQTVHLIGGEPAKRFEITLVPEKQEAKSKDAAPKKPEKAGDGKPEEAEGEKPENAAANEGGEQ